MGRSSSPTLRSPEEAGARTAIDTTPVKLTTSGIFTVAYSPTTRIQPSQYRQVFRDFWENFPFLSRLWRDVFSIAPMLSIIYVLTALWTSMASGISIYLCSAILFILESSISKGQTDDNVIKLLHTLALGWITSVLISTISQRILEEVTSFICCHLRAYFLPKFARVCLRLDTPALARKAASFPNPNNLDQEAPGWPILEALARKIRNVLTIFFQVLAIQHIVMHRQSPDREILAFFYIIRPTLMYLIPSNGVGGGGYTFWTENPHFHRLRALYATIFGLQYRESIVKDGMCNYILQEYECVTKRLGIVKADAFGLSFTISRPWYWDFLYILMLDNYLAVYALAFAWNPSLSSLSTLVILHQSMTEFQKSLSAYCADTTSLSELSLKARKFYKTLQSEPETYQNNLECLKPISTSKRGIKICFREVTLTRPRWGDEFLECVSFEIQPGQLVVIVGSRGKSSILRLLPRLVEPTSGGIFINDRPLASYSTSSLRSSIAFFSPSQEIYPVSVAENIQWGSPSGPYVGRKELDDAVRLGGSENLIHEHGYSAVLNPVPLYGQSIEGCGSGNGPIPDGVFEALKHHSMTEVPISESEKQHLAASRTFLRLRSNSIKLLLIDGATSAMDAAAEHALLSRFRSVGEGMTKIFVMNRFGHILKEADKILCIDEGKIVEEGTHDELMAIPDGYYSVLYNAQADRGPRTVQSPLDIEKDEFEISQG